MTLAKFVNQMMEGNEMGSPTTNIAPEDKETKHTTLSEALEDLIDQVFYFKNTSLFPPHLCARAVLLYGRAKWIQAQYESSVSSKYHRWTKAILEIEFEMSPSLERNKRGPPPETKEDESKTLHNAHIQHKRMIEVRELN